MKNIAILNTCIKGSTGKIAVGLFDKLCEKGYNTYFCYGREDGVTKNGYYKIGNVVNKYIHAGIAKFFGLQGYGSLFPTNKLLKFLHNKQVDTVYIISPHGYYLNEKKLFEYLCEENISIIYIMIDEYAYLGNCAYSNGCEGFLHSCKKCPGRKKIPTLRIINGASMVYEMKKSMYQKIKKITFAGPEYTVEQAKKSPLMDNKRLVVLDEAVNTSFYTPRDTDGLRKELGIKDEQIVLVCVAPFSYERKGCRYYVELAKRFENDERYVFVHVGFNVNPNTVDLPRNYIAIGFLDDQDKLAQYYSLGDLFVFPSLLDTMPNACLEALSAGTPLLCFNISGMPYIADETVATFVEAENVDEMERVVRNVSKKENDQIKTCRNYALQRYDNQKYFEKLISIAEEL